MVRFKLYVISRPRFDSTTVAEFLQDHKTSWREDPDATLAEKIVELAGRICYMSFGNAQSPRTNREYIANLIHQGHESVFEHASWSFLLVGVSRAFSHQLVRHRIGFAFSQLSQQYHNEDDVEFVMPSQLKVSAEASAAWQKAVDTTQQAYRVVRKTLELAPMDANAQLCGRELRRSIRSAARSVLPNAAETKVFFSANGRALRHFLRQRGSIPGDEEMRLVSSELLKVLSVDAPAMFQDFIEELLPDGSPIVNQRKLD
jgi:thymidylate synthase (FAD)